MDRLHTLITVAAPMVLSLSVLLASACNGDPPRPPPSASRVEAVAAKGPGDDAVAGFCDVHARAGAGEPFALPALSARPKEAGSGPRWVNVWASWCKPCIEELPMMQSWSSRLSADGAPATLTFINVDADAEAVARYRAEHPATPESLQLADAGSLASWMEGLGLDAGAGLPVHAFIGGDNRVRCVRSGAVTEDHYALVKSLLQ